MKINVTSQKRSSDVTIAVLAAPDTSKPGTAGKVREVGKAVGDITLREEPAKRGRPATATATVSLGPTSEITREVIRRAGGAAACWLGNQTVKRATVELAALNRLKIDGAAEVFCEGLSLGAFRFDHHKSKTDRGPNLTVDVLTSSGQSKITRSIRRTLVVADAVNLARSWSHEPPNVINPITLGQRVKRFAKTAKLKCTVLDEKQLAKMKAGAILAVGKGSKTPPRLIVLEHAGSGSKKGAKPVVLVGKAITFDTGGYSLKDKAGIVGMKYDKCGGMNVIGVMQAVAALKLKTPVVGIIAAAENMISDEAYRPNDIITALSGKTVEIISTDAEGRLVLADALTYGCRKYKPRAIIDIATLTGGVVVALGMLRAGLMASDDALAEALTASGEHLHERLWRLPLDDEYLEPIKGDDSDLKNSAGREAHAIIAGMFLKQFVDEKVPWAHLDIAATGISDKNQPYCPKGATGFGVRLLANYLERLG